MLLSHLVALFASAVSAAPIPSATTYTVPACATAPAEADVCRLEVVRTEAEVGEALKDADTVWFAEGDRFVVHARRPGDEVSLCCATRTTLDRVGATDLWSVTLRVRNLDRAVIDVLVNRDPANTELPQYRGPKAEPDPALAATIAGKLHDELIDSPAAGERRKVTIYTPPNAQSGRPLRVIYMPDGQVVEGYARMLDPLIRSGRLPPVLLVGLWPNQGAPEVNWRRLDWIVGEDPPRFARVEAFFMREVIPLAERKYGASPRPGDRMLWGTSAGAAWVLSMSARHPDAFGHVAAMSVGSGPAATEAAVGDGPPLFLAAGRFEPEYLAVSRALAERARARGREIVLREPVAGHSFLTWRPLMIEAIRWAFDDARD